MNHVILSSGINRYDLLVGEYSDKNYGSKKCCFMWLKPSMPSPSFVWHKGENVYESYASRSTSMNSNDLGNILTLLKDAYPGIVGDLIGFPRDCN